MRLTNAIKNKAIKEAIKQSSEAAIDKLRQELTDIAQYSADRHYSKKTREWITHAPKGALLTRAEFPLVSKTGVFFNHPLLASYRVRFPLKNPIKVLYEDTAYSNKGLLIPTRYEKRVTAIHAELDEIAKQNKAIKNTIDLALGNITTCKKAIEVYPALKPFLPSSTNECKALAISAAAVNDVLKNIKPTETK